MEQDDLQRMYRVVFEGAAGRIVLQDLEQRACMRESSFNVDPLRMAYNEGRRSLALHIRRMIGEEGDGRGVRGGADEKKGGPGGPPLECVA